MTIIEKIKIFFFGNQDEGKEIRFRVIIASILILFTCVIFYLGYLVNSTNSYSVEEPNSRYSTLYVQSCGYSLKYNAVKLELAEAVDNYIKSIARKWFLKDLLLQRNV